MDFEILELPEIPDALDQFRQIVSKHAARSRGALGSLKSTLDANELTGLLTTLGDAQEQSLLQLADMLSGDSTTVQQLIDPSSTDPDAPSVTIPRRLISDIVGIYKAIQAGFPQVSSELARYKRLRRAGRSSPVMADAGPGSGGQACIFDALGGEGSDWDKCLTLRKLGVSALGREFDEDIPLWYTFHQAFAPTAVVGAPVRACPNPSANAIPPAVLAGRLAIFLEHYGLDCNLHPTQPTKFTAIPTPDPIPVGPASSVGNKGTFINMRLDPPSTPEGTLSGMLAPHFNAVWLDFIIKLAAGGICQDTIQKYFDTGTQIFNNARPAIIDAVRAIQDRGPKFREVPLYKCDLQNIRPEYQDTVQRTPDQDNNGTLHWGLEGVRPGTMNIILDPVSEHFPPNLFTNNFSDPCAPPPPRPEAYKYGNLFVYPRIAPCVQVQTVGGTDSLGVTAAYIFSYSDQGPHAPKRYNPPVTVGDPWSLESNDKGASVSASIQRATATKWVITQKATGAPPTGNDVITTWNRLDLNLVHRPGPRKITVKVKSDVQGTCTGLDVSLGTITQEHDGNNGCSADWTLSTYTSETSLIIQFTVLGGRGPSFGSGHGTVTTEVEYLPDTP